MPADQASPTWFDPDAIASAADPYPLYRRLRDEAPVYHHRAADRSVWVLSRYDDVKAVLMDWRTFSSVASVDAMSHKRATLGDPAAADGHQLITTDPPYHDQLRRTVNERFSPRQIKSLERRIGHEVKLRLAQVRSSDPFDVANDFAWPLTLAIISDIIGVPEEDRSELLTWYQTSEYSGSVDRAKEARTCYAEYFDRLAGQRCSCPQDDLVSELMQAVKREDITRADAVALCEDLFEGGVDVPANLIGNAVLALAEHPDQRAYLTGHGSDPARVRLGVEELARYDPPIQRIPRIARAGLALHGELIPAGATVLLFLGSANHDERRFAAPDALDLTRPPTRNLAFGFGVHFCIGASLARLEAAQALPALFAAIPQYELTAAVERPRGTQVMRALLHLEIGATGAIDDNLARGGSRP